MKVSSISESSSRKDLFIKYANSFMSAPNDEQNNIVENEQKQANEDLNINKSKGIETLTTFSIFPKQVVNGQTIITA